MELLAPAGDLNCLEAAIDAGADAVYLGLSLLNARRGAKNFRPAELETAVAMARQNGVATHLTMNIDIARRESGAAARILSMAKDLGVDAVIARDWAVIGLWRVMADKAVANDEFCPALHLSTQTAVTNCQGAHLARDIGASRVVLARELSLSEIREIGEQSRIEIEVFAQGALCYSISGRCLMSSWGGGRSGNRGLCASPCRVPWAVDGEGVGTAMSMRDLVTVDRLDELKSAGVNAIKIEGRLKKPEWVREAVTLYRQALGPRVSNQQGSDRLPLDGDVVERARNLAAYAGRETTSAYLDGSFSGLTGVSWRKSAQAVQDAIGDFLEQGVTVGPPPEKDAYSLDINVTDRGLSCRCRYRGRTESWRMPKTKIHREKKAVSVEQLFQDLSSTTFGSAVLSESYSNEPDLLLPPRNVKAIHSMIGGIIKRLSGTGGDGSDAILKAPLPDEMRAALAAAEPNPGNVRVLGDRPNQARISVKQLNSSLLPILQGIDLVIVNASVGDMEFIEKFADPGTYTIALPDIFFPSESGQVEDLVRYCRDHSIMLEANCWGSIQVCRNHNAGFITGPGLPVLNPLAVKCLWDLGAQGATISMEADRTQIEDICAAAILPVNLIVYARPVLAYTRIPKTNLLPSESRPANGAWTDRRGIQLKPESASSVTVFRSLTAFDWKTLTNKKIRVANLALDLSGESFPVDVWKKFTRPGGKKGFLFNYERGLK